MPSPLNVIITIVDASIVLCGNVALSCNLGLVFRGGFVEGLALLGEVDEQLVAGVDGSERTARHVSGVSISYAGTRNLPLQLGGVSSENGRQDERVGNGLDVARLFLQRLVKSGLGLLDTSEVNLADGLRDKATDRRRGRSLSELFENVERLLVLVTTLHLVSRGTHRRMSASQTYSSQANPRFGEVNQQVVLGPSSRGLGLLDGKVCSVLLEVDLDDDGNGVNYTAC